MAVTSAKLHFSRIKKISLGREASGIMALEGKNKRQVLTKFIQGAGTKSQQSGKLSLHTVHGKPGRQLSGNGGYFPFPLFPLDGDHPAQHGASSSRGEFGTRCLSDRNGGSEPGEPTGEARADRR